MKRKLPSNLETEDLYSIGVTGLVAAVGIIAARRSALLPPMQLLESGERSWTSFAGQTG